MIYPAGTTHQPWEPISLSPFFPDAETYWYNRPEAFTHRVFSGAFINDILGELGQSYVGLLVSSINLEYTRSAPVGIGNTNRWRFSGVPRPQEEYISGGFVVQSKNEPSAPLIWTLNGEADIWELISGTPTLRTLPVSLTTSIRAVPVISFPTIGSGGIRSSAYDGTEWAQPSGMAIWAISATIITHY